MPNNQIHPTAVVDTSVKLGKGNSILPYTVLTGPLEIGDDNIIGPHVAIGERGGDTRTPRYDDSRAPIRIGHRNIIREFTSIQKPCYQNLTSIGSDTYLMQGIHLGHDVVVEDKVVVAANVGIAGLVKLLDGAYLGMGCNISQRCVIGAYSIVAMGAPCLKHVKPFSRYIPNQPLSLNTYAVKKYGFDKFTAEIEEYVLRGSRPKSREIIALIEKFESCRAESELNETYV